MTEAADHRVKLLSAFTQGIIFELDGECRYRSVWATDERLLARPAEEVIGRTIVEALGEEVGRPLMEGTARVYATGIAETFEYTLPLAVGPRAFEAKVVRVPTEGGPEPYRAVALIRDVTEEKDLVRKLAEAERLAALGVLAAGIGHEINNPLMVVHENARLVAAELDEVAKEDASQAVATKARAMRGKLADMLEQVERMETVVGDLRLFRRDDQAKAAAIDPNAALTSALGLASRQISQCARLETELAERLPLVVASEGKLVQVFLNLLVNAAQSIEEADPRTQTIRVRSSIDSRGWVKVEVSDTGPGVPEAERSKIFDPFYTTKRTGMGLGLSICKQIILGCGGTIDIEPGAAGQGTTFRVALPPGGAAEPRPSRPVDAKVLPRLRLLVIDDKLSLLKVLELSLDPDYEVVTALGASAAMDVLARDATFDGILCDLMMPFSDGMTFYEHLGREHPELQRRVVFMTGGAFTPRAQAFLKTIPNQTIAKPFGPEDLRKVATWSRARL